MPHGRGDLPLVRGGPAVCVEIIDTGVGGITFHVGEVLVGAHRFELRPVGILAGIAVVARFVDHDQAVQDLHPGLGIARGNRELLAQ